MDSIAFHTTAIKTGNGQQPQGTGVLSGSGNGITALGGNLSFFDLMFARLAGESGEAGGLTLPAGTKLTRLEGGNSGVSLNANGAGTASDLQQHILATGTGNELMKSVNAKKKFLEFLNSLLAGMPEGEKATIDLSGKLVKKDPSDDEFPGLVATGLTTGQLTEAMEKFGRDVLQQYEGNEEIQGVIVGLIKMMPPQSGSGFDAIILPKALFVAKGSNDGMTGQAAVSSSPLTAGQPAPTGQLSPGKGSSYNPMAPLTGNADEALMAAAAKGGKGSQAGEALAKLQALSGEGGTGNTAAANSTLPGGFEFPFPGNVFAPGNWSDPILERLGAHPAGQHTTNTANLTQMVTHTSQAGASHPSTQVVAAQLQKMGATGETRNMTLEMEPPDLGRLQVRMEFSAKDKTVKAHMLIEKPETYMMLQRDAHVLERALQNAGLEVTSDSLGFELAQDGQQFSHDGSHENGSGNYSNGADSEPESLEIIETTMNWYVDTETGAQRYDLIV